MEQSDTRESEAEWVSVSDAVRLTGKAERTVWRWVHKGKVESRLTEDGRRELRRDTLPAAEIAGEGSVAGLPVPAELIDALAAKTRPLLAELESQSEHIEAQREEIREQSERIRALEHQVDRLAQLLAERLPPPPDPDPPALPAGDPPRPWWAFWRRG